MTAGIAQTAARADCEPSVDAFLARALNDVARGEGVVSIVLPAPAVDVDSAWRVMAHVLGEGGDDGTQLMWDPPGGRVEVGHGVASVLELHGERRIEQLREQARALWAALEVRAHPEAPAHVPRVFGGLAFAPGMASEPAWEGFGDGRFVLPRWSFSRCARGARLVYSTRGTHAEPREREQARRELAALLEGLERVRRGEGVPRRGQAGRARGVRRVAHADRDAWAERIEAIRQAISSERVNKIVAARRSEVEHVGEVEPAAVLQALGEGYPQCTRFALGCGGSTFLGATPEHLLTKRGLEVETEAMAGSIARGGAHALLGSDKDRLEHDFVVEAIAERLAPLCEHVHRSHQPRVRELPNVLHLHTPISGTLRAPVEAADLVGALHPTPAVGGVPADEAVRWIRAHEQAPRGWYSGPFGWLDREGDAELVVALRSGLVHGCKTWVWAGAGIVDGSRSDAEYAETTLKMRPLLDALGATEGSPSKPDPSPVLREEGAGT